MSDLALRHATLRLGLMPLALLVVLMAMNQPLPFLAPLFCVIVLMLTPIRPPLPLLLKLLVVVALVSSGVSLLAVAVAGQPLAFWLAIAAVVTLAFARIQRQPGDVIALLVLIITAMATVMVQLHPTLPALIPGLMVRNFALAMLWALIAHALWPLTLALASPPPPPPGIDRPLLVIGKSLALLSALGVATLLEDTSAILVAATIANLLRDSDRERVRHAGAELIMANLRGALLVAPTLVAATITPQPLVLVPLALASSLWLTSRGLRGKMPVLQLQTALTVFLVLAASAVAKITAADGGWSVVFDRVLTLLATVIYCQLVLRLLLDLLARRTLAPAAPREP